MTKIARYPGGKGGSGVMQTIINQMPPHKLYVEPFLGISPIMQYKRPANVSVGIDINPVVIKRWDRFEMRNLVKKCGDAFEWLNRYTNDLAIINPETLIYLDPPYLMETRKSKRAIYNHEMTDEDHQRLLDIILELGCMVMISGYFSQMYTSELREWRSITYQSQTRGGSPATEWLWMNYPQPTELHDYSFLGGDFRERERISRKRKRWINRLLKLPQLERAAILSAFDDIPKVGQERQE